MLDWWLICFLGLIYFKNSHDLPKLSTCKPIDCTNNIFQTKNFVVFVLNLLREVGKCPLNSSLRYLKDYEKENLYQTVKLL